MITICIYCGHNKTLALAECASCMRTPRSHQDVIRSIIVCFSESEPYLNFLSLEEVEDIQANIKAGKPILITTEVFKKAEEAYSAVKLNSGPKAIQYFSRISFPITAIIFLVILAMIFI